MGEDDYIIDDFEMIQKEIQPAPPKKDDGETETQDKEAPE